MFILWRDALWFINKKITVYSWNYELQQYYKYALYCDQMTQRCSWFTYQLKSVLFLLKAVINLFIWHVNHWWNTQSCQNVKLNVRSYQMVTENVILSLNVMFKCYREWNMSKYYKEICLPGSWVSGQSTVLSDWAFRSGSMNKNIYILSGRFNSGKSGFPGMKQILGDGGLNILVIKAALLKYIGYGHLDGN